jgi:hypothetical protein
MTLHDALRMAVDDLHRLEDAYHSEVNIHGVDRRGRHAAASTTSGRTYIAMTGNMDEHVELEREFIPPSAKHSLTSAPLK